MTAVSGEKAGRVRFMVVPAAYVALLRDGENGLEVLLQEPLDFGSDAMVG